MNNNNRAVFEIENELKTILNNNSKARYNKERITQEAGFKPLLLELKARGQNVSIQYLTSLLETCNSDISRINKIKRLLLRQGLTFRNVETCKRVIGWRKWKGEVKDFSYKKNKTINLTCYQQNFGHQVCEYEIKTFQIIEA